MTQPATPGEAITRAAQRHAASVEATRALSQEIADKRKSESESAQAAPQENQP